MFEKGRDFVRNNRAQATIFIILGIVIVAGVIAYFVFFAGVSNNNIPSDLQPAYTNFQNCLQNDLKTGINVLGSQGGYIYMPQFYPGSRFSPFSSQLDFLGNPIPYWYYVSGNGVEKQQVPSMTSMENDLAKFIESRARSCDFSEFYSDGLVINMSKPKADVSISDSKVQIDMVMDLVIRKGNESVLVRNHKISINSNIGSMYSDALKVYNNEQKYLFLENRTLDILRLYAPVDGVEIQCAPKTWIAEDVFGNLGDGLDANVAAIKVKGGDYSLNKKNGQYFVEDLGTDTNVKFLTSKNWPHVYEVSPSNGNVLEADPVGNQQGLGALGFCYVPYHFVYDIKYPVLVQIYDDPTGAIFQFPIAVVIQGNHPRRSLEGAEAVGTDTSLCEFANSNVAVNVYDSNLNKIDANVSFECFGTQCDIGQTKGGHLDGKMPQCVNGKIVAQTDGYEEGAYVVTQAQAGQVDIVLSKLYSKNLELKVDGKDYSGDAIISFNKENGSAVTAVYPGQSSIELSEGQYNIQVVIYQNSSMSIPESTQQQCVDVPASGVGGLFGFTQEKCFDIKYPSQSLTNVLSGGGKQNYYISQSELQSSSKIVISTSSLPVPNNVDRLQQNYILYDNNGLGVEFQ